jgi:hypothetical protein
LFVCLFACLTGVHLLSLSLFSLFYVISPIAFFFLIIIADYCFLYSSLVGQYSPAYLISHYLFPCWLRSLLQYSLWLSRRQTPSYLLIPSPSFYVAYASLSLSLLWYLSVLLLFVCLSPVLLS